MNKVNWNDKEEVKKYKREYARQYRKDNYEKWLMWYKRYRELNKEKIRAAQRKHYYKYHDKELDRLKECRKMENIKLRLAAIDVYGGRCVCCGESRIEFLSFHHIDGDGRGHRKQIDSWITIYKWLKEHNYPKGFELLCYNCHMSITFYGYCPHKSSMRKAV